MFMNEDEKGSVPKIQNHHHHHQKPGQPPFFGYETVDEQNPAPVQKVNHFSLIAGFESSQSKCCPSTGGVFAMLFISNSFARIDDYMV